MSQQYPKVHGSDSHLKVLYVFFDVVLLEGVPIGVTKVSNKVKHLF
jgi:hypothetical protein